MRTSKAQVAENRQAILKAAGRLFRERGYDAVTVADVMEAAGLTHGGFYGYFRSKDDLAAQAIAQALEIMERPVDDWGGHVNRYLTEAHRDNLATGCPVAALANETTRSAGVARAEMTRAIGSTIDRMAEVAPGLDENSKRRAAIAGWAAMVGALVLSRLSDEQGLSDEILNETRAWLTMARQV